uniref:Uncharacterized protein n=1 Tax=Caenorhabditis japonica TaxID=281687 RepID=A0A2Q4SWE1_CAEJA
MRSLFFASAILLVLIESKPQTIAVTGVTICNKRRTTAEVTLWEKDWFDPDDKLGSTVSSEDGKFFVMGTEDEFNTIDPYLVITHTCNVKKAGCKRISRYEIPKEFVRKTFDMMYIALDIVTGNDKEKC